MRSFTEVIKDVGYFISKNSPQLLSGLACAGVVSTAYLAGKATIKARYLLEDYLEFDPDDPDAEGIFNWKNLTKEEKKTFVKEVSKIYATTVISGITSISAIIASQHISSKRAAVIASLYSISKDTLERYQAKTLEAIGENAEKAIRAKVRKEQIEANPPVIGGPTGNVYLASQGRFLCRDNINESNYFYSDYETIRAAINDFNNQLINGDIFLTLNEFYDMVGARNIKMGDEVGWDIGSGIVTYDIITAMADIEGHMNEPCLVIEFGRMPIARTGYC